MDTLICVISASLILTYGGMGVWLLLRQCRSGSVLWIGGGLLAGGIFLYQYLFTAAEYIAKALVIALVIFILDKLLG